jgi:4-amino-4-deoxy-L-arabinose transferase-like glycosyltransferase
MLYRAAQETTIVDETPHITAGYSYTVLRDYRLNPEHPPLVKMLSALPLALKDLSFPTDSPYWTRGINAQWDIGGLFLFGGGNDAVSVTFWARMAPLLLTLLLGVLLFLWAFERAGALGASIAITLFAFSPTFLAHGPLVTTDVGAAFGALVATYFLIRWLKNQTGRNLLYAGIAFGIAQLIKFSMILLVPYFGIAILVWIFLQDKPSLPKRAVKRSRTLVLLYARAIASYTARLILIGVIGILTLYPVYAYTISNYPASVQRAQTSAILEGSSYPALAQATIWASDKTILRPYAQFALGHLMVFERVKDGNTVYFLGDVAKEAWVEYFPVVFLLKEPLALLALIALVTITTVRSFFTTTKHELSTWASRYTVEIILFLFVLLYWVVSMTGNLNIGIRHILPTMPFVYIILAVALVAWVRGKNQSSSPANLRQLLALWYTRWLKVSVLGVLLAWYVFSSLSAYPHSLAYFNELAGGPSGGYRFVTDSNLDWGQDLRSLAEFVQENNISAIRLDYFGTANIEYFLGDAYIPFGNTPPERHGWVAVSATKMQEGRATPTKGYADRPTDYYRWLDEYEPRAILGHTIFVYYIP